MYMYRLKLNHDTHTYIYIYVKADMARTYKPVSAGTLSARKAEKGAADMPRVGPPQLHW